MKKWALCILSACMLLIGFTAFSEFTGSATKVEAAVLNGWDQSSTGDWYYYSNGVLQHGWLLYNGTWYYLDPDTGAMYSSRGLYYNNNSYEFDSSGAMVTGWYWDGLTQGWYWYNPMHTQAYYNSNLPEGAMYTGWLYYEGYWYYLETNYLDTTGKMVASKTEVINGTAYTFDSHGHCLNP